MHDGLIRRYLERCGVEDLKHTMKSIIASRQIIGGNWNWVIKEFPKELEACRKRQKVKAETLLIVMIDADEFSTQDRLKQLSESAPRLGDDPLVVLIPRRHVETWIRAALHPDESLNETDDYKRSLKMLSKSDLSKAADTIHAWVHGESGQSPLSLSTLPALQQSLPAWKRIG